MHSGGSGGLLKVLGQKNEYSYLLLSICFSANWYKSNGDFNFLGGQQIGLSQF